MKDHSTIISSVQYMTFSKQTTEHGTKSHGVCPQKSYSQAKMKSPLTITL